ncbi:Hypothetical predicted protein [Podarcis lilfordi]|uniref:Uncharacterized protein n=1 Tax=Podarcis lilfordi TaxID=74358 RepID=A0AA35LKJ9_9SAUR|nr:Hypothetical predicted protein [Podarcis lilfordi]
MPARPHGYTCRRASELLSARPRPRSDGIVEAGTYTRAHIHTCYSLPTDTIVCNLISGTGPLCSFAVHYMKKHRCSGLHRPGRLSLPEPDMYKHSNKPRKATKPRKIRRSHIKAKLSRKTFARLLESPGGFLLRHWPLEGAPAAHKTCTYTARCT